MVSNLIWVLLPNLGQCISAVVGLEETMRDYANNKVILYQSTYARNPVPLAAADATLDQIKKGHMDSNIEKVGNVLMKGMPVDVLRWRQSLYIKC